VNGGRRVENVTCPECGEPLFEHSPADFDPTDVDVVHRGTFGSSWCVVACVACGYLERMLPLPGPTSHVEISPALGSRTVISGRAVPARRW
jgi:hypothetical protein